jgi:hypothetical protein
VREEDLVDQTTHYEPIIERPIAFFTQCQKRRVRTGCPEKYKSLILGVGVVLRGGVGDGGQG